MGMIGRLNGTRVYLDTNVFIYALEGHELFAEAARRVMQTVCANPANCITSELTLAEVLVLPIKQKNQRLTENYLEVLTGQSNVSLAPVTREILIDAAHLRSSSRVKLPDAIHLATAIASQCRIIVTQDGSMPPIGGLEFLPLSQLRPS